MGMWCLQMCVICLDEEIEKREECILACGHTFHTKCIIQWGFHQASENKKNCCPLCRSTGSFFQLRVLDPDEMIERISDSPPHMKSTVIATVIRDKYSNWAVGYLKCSNGRVSLTEVQTSMYESPYLTFYNPITNQKYISNAFSRKRGVVLHNI